MTETKKTQDLDKTRLLLLGLNLLNKLPCAVVQPQAKVTPPSQLVEKLKSPPISPQRQNPIVEDGTRKRKREPSTDDDVREVDKREKRKMMNRVSAQSARDRKKAYIDDLERKIALLEEKNKKLEEENALLKNQTSSLSQENEQLGEQLSQTATVTAQGDMLQALLKETLLQEPLAQGSAVPKHKVSPQQKRFLKQWLLLQIVLAFNLGCWPASLTMCPQERRLDSTGEHPASLMLTSFSDNHQPLLRDAPWWGSKWNPLKNSW